MEELTMSTSQAQFIPLLYSSSTGGLVGRNDDSGLIYHSYTEASTRTNSSTNLAYSGGFVGRNAGIIRNTYATGDVYSTSTHNDRPIGGGFAAYNMRGTISNSYATGSVTVSSALRQYLRWWICGL